MASPISDPTRGISHLSSSDIRSNVIQQIVADHAQKIAKTYPSAIRSTYQKAADNLRTPYWDWAKVPQRFPDVMTWPSVRITTAKGVQNVTNPLFQYKFLSHPEPAEWFPSDSWLGSMPNTVRYPDENNQSRNALINTVWADDGSYLIKDVVGILSHTYFPSANITN